MLGVTLAICASVGAGVGAEWRWGERAHALTRRVLDVLLYLCLPFIAFFTIASLHVTTGLGVGLLVGYAELAIVTGLAYVIGSRVLRLPRPATGALMCAVALVNTGYLGLPITAAALGADQLGPAIAWDALVSAPMLLVVGFATGAIFGARAGDTRRERLRAFVVRNPPLLAVLLGLLAPRSLAPEAMVHVARALAVGLIVPGFFALGVFLMIEREEGTLPFPPPFTLPVAVAVALRVLVAPALVATASALIVRLPDAYLLAAAMPTGINGLVVAHAYGLDLRLLASATAWSTAVVVAAALLAAVPG
jgi:predicted permease